jgi:DNA repair photolyase
MELFGLNIEDGLELAGKVDPKYRPVFEVLLPEHRAALAWYFLPHRSSKGVLGVTRPRILKWYCPFANQKEFPSGHRYCINVYTGCGHKCEYCYAVGYEPDEPNCKKDFEHGLLHDLDDLEKYNVPPAPVHLSNSTDPFQKLEEQVGQTRFALQQILRYRHRFTSVILLTKNPTIAVQSEYLKLLRQLRELPENHPRRQEFVQRNLPALRLEVSLAFRQDKYRAVFDPAAPPIEDRIDAIGKLGQAGIPIVLRIDPLLPRSPLPGGKRMADFDLPEAQSLDDLKQLVTLATEVNAMHIVYSVAKIIQPRFKSMSKTMENLKRSYEHLAHPSKLVFRGGSWRLPHEVAQQHIVDPFLRICQEHHIAAMFCKQNLVETP